MEVYILELLHRCVLDQQVENLLVVKYSYQNLSLEDTARELGQGQKGRQACSYQWRKQLIEDAGSSRLRLR